MGQRGVRYLVGLVATFCLLGQFSSLAHNLLVQHATCAEHGEIVHTGATSAPEGAATEVAADPTVGDSGASEPAEGHGHDHCLAVAHGRGHVGLQTVDAAVALDQPAKRVVAVTTGTARPVSYALYRLAPKNSPPA